LRVIGNGRNLIDVVWVENAADAHALAAVSDRAWGHVYFISQGTPVRFWDWINTLLEAIGEPAASGRIPYGAARFIGTVLEKTYGWCGLSGEPVMTRFLASELARSHYFDITAARRDLGYTPRVSVSDGIARLAAWYRGDGSSCAG
jgi:nucleoside-diphosphate-sugar epimerase